MTLIHIAIGLIALWVIIYIGFKIVKWFVHTLLILGIIALIVWIIFGGQHLSYVIPFINQTVTI